MRIGRHQGQVSIKFMTKSGKHDKEPNRLEMIRTRTTQTAHAHDAGTLHTHTHTRER